MSLLSFIASLSGGAATVAPDVAAKRAFLVIGDSIANGTNNRTNEATPDPAGALLEWSGSAWAQVSDTATANDGSQWPQFALTYKQHTGENVHLIETALGGAEAYPNGDASNWYTSGNLYTPARDTAQAALATAGATLEGVIIHLGINDARGAQTIANIQTGFTSLIDRINADFNTPAIYMVQIGREENGYTQRVRDVQNIIAGLPTTYPNVKIADYLEPYEAKGYYGPDNLHLNQPGNDYLGTRLANYVATGAAGFDDTKAFTLRETYDIDRYLFTGQLVKNPVSGKVVHLMHNGNAHSFDAGKKVSARVSNDGITFGTIFDVADPVEGGVQDVGNGYDSNGRLHLVYCVHESFATGVGHYVMYQYSDDDGATWSAPANLGLPPNGHTTFRALGKIIESNGVLMKPIYSAADEGSFGTQSSRWVLRKTSAAAEWQWVHVETTAAYVNEGAMIAHGSEVLYVARVEDVTGTTDDTARYKIYKSTDNGQTWAVQGTTGFGETFAYAHPAHLEKFKIGTTDVIACYFLNRDTKEYKIIYGKAADVMAGVTGWNVNTKITLLDFDTYAGAARSGYGAFYHPNNDLFARGMAYVDLNATANALYFDLPTTHYENLKTQLGITA